MMILILSMDRPAVGLRLPKLPILLTALWQLFLVGNFKPSFQQCLKKDNFNVIQHVFFHTSPLLVDAGILSLLTNADNPFPSTIAIYSIKFEI